MKFQGESLPRLPVSPSASNLPSRLLVLLTMISSLLADLWDEFPEAQGPDSIDQSRGPPVRSPETGPSQLPTDMFSACPEAPVESHGSKRSMSDIFSRSVDSADSGHSPSPPRTRQRGVSPPRAPETGARRLDTSSPSYLDAISGREPEPAANGPAGDPAVAAAIVYQCKCVTKGGAGRSCGDRQRWTVADVRSCQAGTRRLGNTGQRSEHARAMLKHL